MIKILKRRPLVLQFVAVAGITLFLLLIVVLKIPSAFSNFWAEDGVFYQQALDSRFPLDFFISGGGYVIFISRIISNLVTIGPIEYAPIVNIVLVIAFLGFFIERLYVNLGYLIKSKIYKGIVCMSVVLLPINNYETIASGTALHFQLLFIALIITLAARRKNTLSITDLMVLSISLLSDPFAVIALIPLLLGRKSNILKFWKSKTHILLLLIGSVALQLVMMIIFHLRGDRALGASHSIIKASYLFLDRVIGSAFIPNWGYISSDSLQAGKITTYLMVRAAIGLSCLGLIAIGLIMHLRKRFSREEMHSKATLVWLVSLPSLYWFTVGYLSNPEPRYAVFPALSFILAVFILLDHLSCRKEPKRTLRIVGYFVLGLSILIWMLSASPSARRLTGHNWQSQIDRAKAECKTSGGGAVSIKILPIDDIWKLEFSCQTLIK